MNLSPEEKKVGKDNFHEATGTTRRDFLKGAVASAVAVGGAAALGGAYFKYTKIDNPLRVGIIGTGDEGNVLIGALNPDFIDVVAIADIRPYSRYRAYHGDWYAPGALAARPGLLKVYEKKYGWKNEDEARGHITEYHDDYRELLDNEDIEAVIIALPLHLHHEAAVAAMRKGKHVLTEKLMGQTVAQCKEMARVAAETGRVMAVGHQRHYSILYDNAVDQIRRGLIGDIHHIRAQWHRGNLPGKDSWQPPMPCAYMTPEEFKSAREAAKTEKREKQFLEEYGILPELHAWEAINAGKHSIKPRTADDIKMWKMRLGQKRAQLTDVAIADVVGPDYGYQSKTLEDGRERTPLEELIRWRLWNRTGGGLMAELGSHQLDAASIFIAAQNNGHKVKPLSVTAVGGRHIFPADRDCDDHVYCTFEFPGKGYYKSADATDVADPNKKIVVTYSSINGNGFGGYGEIVFGTNGTLILEQEQDAMLFKGSDTATRVSVKMSDDKAAMDTYETGGGAAAVAAAAGADGPPSRGYREEIEHWAWCIRNPGNQPHCTPTVALGDAVIALTSNLAIAQQKRIDFDPNWFDPNNDATPEGDVPRKAADVG